MISRIALIGLVLLLSLTGKRRVERAIATVYGFWMLLLVTLAAFNHLDWVNALSLALAVACFAALAWITLRSPSEVLSRLRTQVLTPGLLIFAALALVFAYLTKPMVVWWGDDIFYWALEPKAVWYLGGLTDSLGSLAGNFGKYTPGMAVMQWQALSWGGEFSEPMLFYTLFMSYTVFLLPLTERIRWKQWWLIPPACVLLIALPMLANMLSYSMLSVDMALAACFAFVLITLDDSPEDRLAVASGLIAMVLIKQSGLLLAAMAWIWALLRRQRAPKAGKPAVRASVGTILGWLSPLLVWGLWMAFCSWKGLTGAHEDQTLANLGAYLTGATAWPEAWSRMPGAMWTALTTMPTTEKFLTGLPLVSIPRLYWLALLIVAPWLMVRAHGRSRVAKLSAYALIGTVAYLALILVSFATTFNLEINAYTGEKINNLRLLLERYLSPWILGVGALELAWAAEALSHRRLGVPTRAVAGVAIFAALMLCVNWPTLLDALIPDRYMGVEQNVSVVDRTEETNFWADELEQRAGAVVLVGFSNDAEYIENLNYTYVPARIVLPRQESNDAQTLPQDIRERHINYVVCLDDANELYQAALTYTEDEWLDTYTLYAVQDDADGLMLVYPE